jgi:hypothetical protein
MDITPTTLKRWFDTKDRIKRQKKRLRHTISKSKRRQEDTLEMRLYIEFKATRAIGRQIGISNLIFKFIFTNLDI